MVARTGSRMKKALIVETTVAGGEIVQDLEVINRSEFPVDGKNEQENILITEPEISENENILISEPEIRENENVPELTADEMLRQARAASRQQQKPEDNVPHQEQIPNDPTESTQQASHEIETARKEAALRVIKSTEQGQLARLQDGIKAGIADISDFNKGREIGRLLALAESTNADSAQLSQQLEQVRTHTDIQTAQVVHLALKELGFNMTGDPSGESVNPLEGTVLAGLLPSRSTSMFRIFETE